MIDRLRRYVSLVISSELTATVLHATRLLEPTSDSVDEEVLSLVPNLTFDELILSVCRGPRALAHPSRGQIDVLDISKGLRSPCRDPIHLVRTYTQPRARDGFRSYCHCGPCILRCLRFCHSSSHNQTSVILNPEYPLQRRGLRQ